MFLGRYDFAGHPGDLLPRYHAMMDQVPDGDVGLHACITHPGGITIYDTCPTVEVFRTFSSSPDFLDLVRSVGLPEPTVTPLGDVLSARFGATRLA